jgi:hypothetical protein
MRLTVVETMANIINNIDVIINNFIIFISMVRGCDSLRLLSFMAQMISASSWVARQSKYLANSPGLGNKEAIVS